MAATTVANKPIRFNVQPPFLPKAAKLFRDPFRKIRASTAFHLPGNRKPWKAWPHRTRNAPSSSRPNPPGLRNEADLSPPPPFRQTRGPLFSERLRSRREFPWPRKARKPSPSHPPRTVVPWKAPRCPSPPEPDELRRLGQRHPLRGRGKAAAAATHAGLHLVVISHRARGRHRR